MSPDLDGKRLELLKEAFPRLPGWPSSGNRVARGNLALTDMEAAAKALGVKLLSLEVRSLDDFDSAFARAKRDGAQALITTAGANYQYSATSGVGLRGKEPGAGDLPLQ